MRSQPLGRAGQRVAEFALIGGVRAVHALPFESVSTVVGAAVAVYQVGNLLQVVGDHGPPDAGLVGDLLAAAVGSTADMIPAPKIVFVPALFPAPGRHSFRGHRNGDAAADRRSQKPICRTCGFTDYI